MAGILVVERVGLCVAGGEQTDKKWCGGVFVLSPAFIKVVVIWSWFIGSSVLGYPIPVKNGHNMRIDPSITISDLYSMYPEPVRAADSRIKHRGNCRRLHVLIRKEDHLPSLFVAHDRGFLPWAVVVAYLTAACLALLAVRRSNSSERYFWLTIAVIMLAVGLNKQLDLQTTITLYLRRLAHHGGWADIRRQGEYVSLVMLGLAFIGIVGLLFRFRPRRGSTGAVAVLGVSMVATFILYRAMQIYHVLPKLGQTALMTDTMLELSGIVIIIVALGMQLWRGQ